MICVVVGARPNFIKMAPILREAHNRGFKTLFVHTGQHYDPALSTVFLHELNLPTPDVTLGVGSGSHAQQMARIMQAFEPVCVRHRPELVIVAGDVNSTLGCALTAAKLSLPVAHVEAGLRTFDRTMPEEINRVLTDHLATLLFTTETSATQNLLHEGIPSERIHFVGNTMIDSLREHLNQALALEPWQDYGFTPGGYGIVTLHRPLNVDSAQQVSLLVNALNQVGERLPLLFPMHPRTRAQNAPIWEGLHGVRVTAPLGYLAFLGLMAKAQVVITDSGGIQEETTALGVRCVTLRPTTERPITLTQGTNILVGSSPEVLLEAVFGPVKAPCPSPPLWDGHAARRILDVLERWLHAPTP